MKNVTRMTDLILVTELENEVVIKQPYDMAAMDFMSCHIPYSDIVCMSGGYSVSRVDVLMNGNTISGEDLNKLAFPTSYFEKATFSDTGIHASLRSELAFRRMFNQIVEQQNIPNVSWDGVEISLVDNYDGTCTVVMSHEE